ncbi:MAG TPA: elongation factor P [Gemmataceae bacterium]|nr:elongation factor P [Gemmataceae bacterium]
MADIKNIDIRKGMVFIGEDGQLYQCLDRDLNTPGNWRAILQLKVRNLKTDSITMNRVRPDDKVKLAYLDTRKMQYSYREGDNYIFMDSETFDQVPLKAEFVGDQILYLKENDEVLVTMYEGKPLSFQLPGTVELAVTETEPGIKGATAAAQTKPATTETGLIVQVPSFINKGDVVKIDTAEGKYIGRVTK